jgi:magnesium-dependent phosphatase 1
MSTTELFSNGKKPSLLVFDCDWTIWPFDCDKDVIAPFVISAYTGVHDRFGRPANPYRDVPHLVAAALHASIPVAYLSRNPSAGSVKQLLQAIEITHEKSLWDAMPSPDYFHCYSSGGVGKGKDKHFAALKEKTGIPFSEMLFFDDLPDNIAAAHALGITTIQIDPRRGLTLGYFETGLAGFHRAHLLAEAEAEVAAEAVLAPVAEPMAAMTAEPDGSKTIDVPYGWRSREIRDEEAAIRRRDARLGLHGFQEMVRARTEDAAFAAAAAAVADT